MNIKHLYKAAMIPLIAGLTACGTVLPNRASYPVGMTPEDMKKGPQSTVTTAEDSTERMEKDEGPRKTEVSQDIGRDGSDGLASTNFDESRAARIASESGSKGQKQDPYRYRDERRISGRTKLPPVEAEKSDLGFNALSKVFNVSYDTAFNRAVDGMLFLPLRTVSMDGGLITTEWTMDVNLAYETLAGINIFGDGTRLVRYRYNVRFYRHGANRTEIVVIPFAQITKNRRWFDGKPAIAITEKLMRKLIKTVEG